MNNFLLLTDGIDWFLTSFAKRSNSKKIFNWF
jgi:hypothetical protein